MPSLAADRVSIAGVGQAVRDYGRYGAPPNRQTTPALVG
ncbi:hypothetical protein FHS94_001433 [Sphingomonas aerophila]|uniref:Uncharacterized protein n=1 Tax=Sphingomonas aerophila TaxID=1344948 RepID=A0A7W9BCC2_9SPHN|nr:hypothetical protein [Sphingomonas aerophila]